MKNLNRRQFLKGSASALGALSLPAYWLPNPVHASGTGPKKLVLFFMNGGNDSMNMIVPTKTYATDGNGGGEIVDGELSHPMSQYDYYKQLRPTLQLMKSGHPGGDDLLPLAEFDAANYADAHQLSLSDDALVSSPSPTTPGIHPVGKVEFSFHPALNGLRDIWDAGHLAVFPATHCGPDANRSHFFQTEYLGHGLNTEHSNQQGDGKGWIGRYFEAKYGSPSANGIEGFDFESGYHPLMDGDIPVLGISDPENVFLGRSGDRDDIRRNTLEMNAARKSTASDGYNDYADIQSALFARVTKLNAVDYSSTVSYPDSSTGRSFRRAAALIKDSVIGQEIEVINIDRGGFDTHSNQVDENDSASGSHASSMRDCSDSIKAFYDDMAQANLGDDVLVLVQTEFGRTTDENDNLGTDHARAACWMVIGGENSAASNKNIHGGMYGAWPGIAVDVEDPPSSGNMHTDLDGSSRYYLHQTTDYRDILSEIIGDFLDNSVNESAAFNPGGSNDYVRAPQGFIDVT